MPKSAKSSSGPLNIADETRLIAGAKNGDPGSFEQLVDLYMGRGIQVAMGYVGNREDALDMAQETFYRVYKSLDRFRDGEPFAPWFFRILRNACLNFLAKHRKPGHFSLQAKSDEEKDYDLPDGINLGPPSQVEMQESHRQFWRALEKLGMNHREIIMLRHFEELDYAAIAKVLDIPIGTVMSRLYHARQKLRAALEPYMEGKL
ncbi:MAG: RNA polymerase sigma factor [Planctomycetota bacterium]|jgi:RNA polymerase sigma-70 factor (ECF subfamily)